MDTENIGNVLHTQEIGDDWREMTYPFKNIPLPYSYSALEPFVDAKTVELHHDKHLQKYIDNLNAALQGHTEYHSWSLTKILQKINSIPAGIRTAVKNNAGGTYNHFLYFGQLSPQADKSAYGSQINHQSPKPQADKPIYNPQESYSIAQTMPKDLAAMLKSAFGSVEAFLSGIKDAAMSVFGSGYAWLTKSPSGKLAISTTANQDCPISAGLSPLITVDVWEHAYYLKYKNQRADYIDNIIKIINWNSILK